MKLPVQRSVPVTTIIVKPKGKMTAAIMRMRPGAYVWNHGEAFVLRETAQAKARRVPATKDEMKVLSIRMLALPVPAREASSVASFAV